ncbi:hypothetical protein GYMLUDRAFT_86474 [Collybiopsis luxurians FD-317 M1]|uniref:Uncharacterized protein n=1 Tax=Collybiopsis luxurians FD-317 M1 TaxID=944289 RepID=A0A0D0CHU2_9AGAR|nr:hypothetical protein GYMLUDRAFT_86474 [Collybiopsis luxurians FD-317 M1]
MTIGAIPPVVFPPPPKAGSSTGFPLMARKKRKTSLPWQQSWSCDRGAACHFRWTLPNSITPQASHDRIFHSSYISNPNYDEDDETGETGPMRLFRDGTCGLLPCWCDNPEHSRYSQLVMRKLLMKHSQLLDAHDPNFLDPVPSPEPEDELNNELNRMAEEGESVTGSDIGSRDDLNYAEGGDDNQADVQSDGSREEGEEYQESANSEEASNDTSDRLIPTKLAYRFTGIPPAPIRLKRKRNTKGISLALQEVNGLYTYNHSSGSFTCSHHLPGSSDLSWDGSCAVLAFVRVMFVPILKSFVRTDFGRMIGRTELEELLKQTTDLACLHNARWGGKRRQQVVIPLLKHIDRAFPESLLNFEEIAQLASKLQILRPIPFLPRPEPTAPCPFCRLYFPVPRRWQAHTKDCPECPNYKALVRLRKPSGYLGKSLWSQSLSNEPKFQRFRVLMVKDYHPRAETAKQVLLQIPACARSTPQLNRPHYIPHHWWDILLALKFRPALSPNLQLTGDGLDPMVLRDLVSSSSHAALKYPVGSMRRVQEEGLQACHKGFILYLRHAGSAVQKTFNFSKILRRYSGLNFKHGFFAQETYSLYARIATDTLAFVLRWTDSKIRQDLRLQLTKDLCDAIEAIQQRLQNLSQPPTSKLLAPLLHRFVVALVQSTDSMTSGGMTLVEYVLLCRSIRADGTAFRSASAFTKDLAMYCRLFSSATLLAALSGGWEKDYELSADIDENPMERRQNRETEGDEQQEEEGKSVGEEDDDSEVGGDEEEEDEDDEEGEGEEDLEDGEDESEDEEDEDEDEEEGETEEEDNTRTLPLLHELVDIANPERDKRFGSLMEQLIKEVLEKTGSNKNPFLVIRGLWTAADTASRLEAGAKTFFPHPSNLKFSYVPNSGPSHELHLTDFAKNANLELKELRACLENLVPSSLMPLMESFDIRKLRDDPTSPTSLFIRPDNSRYLQPFAEQLLAHLTNPKSGAEERHLMTRGHLNEEKARLYIRDTEKMPKSVVKGLFPILGISPRGFQGSSLSYHSDGSMARSLKIFDQWVILCNPISKQDSQKQYECFWTVPEDYAWYLLFYLGVLRPVVISLLESSAINDGSAIPELKEYIFVHALGRREKHRWEGPDIDRCLKQNFLGLDANGLRHVTTGIIRHWYPDLARANDDIRAPTFSSPLDRQGQHSSKVSQMHYARTVFVKGTTFNEPEFYSQIRISMAIQRLDDVAKKCGLDSRYKTLSSVDALAVNGHRAMLAARQFVLTQDPGYNIASGDRQAIEEKCRSLSRVKPFLRGTGANEIQGNWVSEWRTLGDQGLVQVSAALAHGYILEGAANSSLQLGYSPKFVANAVYLIECAISDWSTGSYSEVDWENDSNRETVVNSIEHAILSFKQAHIEEWVKFRLQVDNVVLSKSTLKKPSSIPVPYFNVGIFPPLELGDDNEEESHHVRREPESLEELNTREKRQNEEQRRIEECEEVHGLKEIEGIEEMAGVENVPGGEGKTKQGKKKAREKEQGKKHKGKKTLQNNEGHSEKQKARERLGGKSTRDEVKTQSTPVLKSGGRILSSTSANGKRSRDQDVTTDRDEPSKRIKAK